MTPVPISERLADALDGGGLHYGLIRDALAEVERLTIQLATMTGNRDRADAINRAQLAEHAETTARLTELLRQARCSVRCRKQGTGGNYGYYGPCGECYECKLKAEIRGALGEGT